MRLSHLRGRFVWAMLLAVSQCSLGQAGTLSLTDNLIFYVPFEGTAEDASGNEVITLVNNEITFSSGIVGQAVDFQNPVPATTPTGRYVYTRVNQSLGTSDFSVQVWVKGTQMAVDPNRRDPAIIANKDWLSGSFVGWAIARGDENENTGGGIQWNFDTSQSTRLDMDIPASTALLEDGNWHHVVVTHDRDGDATMYFDGRLVTTRDISAHDGASIDSGFPIAIGTGGNLGRRWNAFFNGMIDEAAIWKRLISADEVQVLYNSGNGRPIPEPSTLLLALLATAGIGGWRKRVGRRSSV